MRRFLGDLRDELDTSEDPDPLAELGWREWLNRMYVDPGMYAFGEHHVEGWDHVWNIEVDDTPDSLLMAYPRKGGKSTGVELKVWSLCLRGRRKYFLYVCDSQDQADEHVTSIGSLFERKSVEIYYPKHAKRRVNKYGSSKGWRRNRLVTAGGAIVDALGLDTARTRGIKFEGTVPDACVLDDVDGEFDSTRVTKKKEKSIRTKILPALQPNAFILFAQNLIIPHGLLARLVDDKADYLFNRQKIGPIKAIDDIETVRIFDKKRQRMRTVITGGTPTWEGLDIPKCQALIDRNGWESFNTEQQQNVYEKKGALWTKSLINETRTQYGDLPLDETGEPVFRRVVVGVDPSGGGDEIGIIVGALGHNGHGYVLSDNTQPGPKGPHNWGFQSCESYREFKADTIVAETNFGGDMVISNIRAHSKNVPVKKLTASRGKSVRAQPVRSLYEEDLIHHVGSFPELEAEMTSWVPGESKDSPNRLDALVWVFIELMLEEQVYTGGAGTIHMGR